LLECKDFFKNKSQSQIIIWRAPGRFAASPTQPYKCGQDVKVNVKVNTNAVWAFAEINKFAEIKKLTLILKY